MKYEQMMKEYDNFIAGGSFFILTATLTSSE
jgi:hypothetical protein